MNFRFQPHGATLLISLLASYKLTGHKSAEQQKLPGSICCRKLSTMLKTKS